MCLIIDMMHLYSWHYAVIDFKSPVLLTDIIIPPCKALASLTISYWQAGEDQMQAEVLAHSEEIGMKAVVMSNIIPSISCQYIKVGLMIYWDPQEIFYIKDFISS